jgi:hypothetical protein
MKVLSKGMISYVQASVLVTLQKYYNNVQDLKLIHICSAQHGTGTGTVQGTSGSLLQDSTLQGKTALKDSTFARENST